MASCITWKPGIILFEKTKIGLNYSISARGRKLRQGTDLYGVSFSDRPKDFHLKHYCCFSAKKIETKVIRHFTRKYRDKQKVKDACELLV